MPRKWLLPLALCIAAVASPADCEEQSFVSATARAKNSSARLIAAEPGADGAYLAGVEIALQPKTLTYWRQPGEAGEPPRFDFSRSENVASVEPLFPVPKHIEEAGALVAGYDASVIFPLRVTARDAKAPVKLDLELNYAACRDMCLPARAHLSLTPPLSGASPFAAALKAALARVPRQLTGEESQAQLKVARAGEAQWRLDYRGPGKAMDVFAEGPDPLYVDAARSKSGAGFDLTLSTNGATPPADGVPTTLTIVIDQGAVEGRVLLK